MATEEVFRFVNVRPVQKAPEGRVQRRFPRYGEGKSPFHIELEQLSGSSVHQEAVKKARVRLDADLAELADAPKVVRAAQRASSESTVQKAKREAEKIIGAKPATYLKSAAATRLRNALWDRLYAHTILPEERPEQREMVIGAIRALHLLQILVTQDDAAQPPSPDEMANFRPLIPKGVVPSSPVVDDKDEKDKKDRARDRLKKVFAETMAFKTAIEDLRNTDRAYQADELRKTLDLKEINKPGMSLASKLPLKGPTIDVRVANMLGGAGGEHDVAGGEPVRVVEHKRLVIPKKLPWVFDQFGSANLKGKTTELLVRRKNELFEREVGDVAVTLDHEKYEVVVDYLRTLPRSDLQYIRDDETYQALLREVPVPWYGAVPLTAPVAGNVTPSSQPGSASARGIQPLGIGDLLVVQQELLRYTAGEVAHIENVMKTEHKNRIHSRLREVEEIVVVETEELEETEKDLQTTERFELHKESQKTIESQMSIEAGVSITASYGTVSVTAHADFALSQSSSESNSTASSFAREITDRSVSRIMRRAREERTRRTLERFEEKNEHGFDNKAGAGHVIGIYRWVDKYYKHRLINYGRRLMFEFIIPEPAAFYLHVQSGSKIPGVTLKRPDPPMVSGRPLKPTDLNRWNYTDFVAAYGVKDIESYPDEVISIGAAYGQASTPGTADNTDFAGVSEKLVVPNGYECRDVYGELSWQGYRGTHFLDCFIGGQSWGSITAAGMQGIIPISVKGWISAFHVNVVAICDLKPETKAAWQLKAYESIMTAYEAAVANYEQQVAAAQIQAGVQIQGRNPEINRRIESDELRKSVLRVLTNNFAKTRVGGMWRFNEMFDAMQANGQYGYPEINIAESIVEGRITQFFEQAFEWGNLTYRFYPYFWGRKDGWDEIFPLSDTDPQFTDFLRAGSARVIAPVHPRYTETILHYLTTNEIWNGGDPPTLDDPLYISIVDELKADADADLSGPLPACALDSTHPCLVDEWELKLPTTLVYLQKDEKLPDFT